MKWISDNKWFVGVIVLIVFLFYWFQVRPAQIRAKCVDEADIEQSVAYPPLTNAERDNAYQRCINYNGLVN